MKIEITTSSSAAAQIVRAKALELLSGVEDHLGNDLSCLVSPVLGRTPVYTVYIASWWTSIENFKKIPGGMGGHPLDAANKKLLAFAYDNPEDYQVQVKRWYD